MNTQKKYPLVSVVLNVYNEKDTIVECLSRIRRQNYPQDKIEIILVDDKSTDSTVLLAQQFNVIVVTSGFRNRERAKSIGMQYAAGELLLLMDADVFLISVNYIKRCVDLLNAYPNAVACQSIRWHYRRSDYIVNRYCNLFGISDPLALYLGKRGSLMATETQWPHKRVIKNKGKDFFLVKFTLNNLPTVGAVGYMVRRREIMETSWKPYFFHLDTAYELVQKGYDEFLMVKLAVEHRYVHSLQEYFGKLSRNLFLFLSLRQHRKYTYNLSFLRLISRVFLMMCIIFPCYQSIRGYMKKNDPAWFLHPILCFIVPIFYAGVVITWYFGLLTRSCKHAMTLLKRMT